MKVNYDFCLTSIDNLLVCWYAEHDDFLAGELNACHPAPGVSLDVS